MRFLVDAQLPPSLAQWLVERGHEAASVRDVGLQNAKDMAIWDFALDGDWIIVTKDEDFAARIAQINKSPKVVWLRIGNSTNKFLLRWIEPLLPEIIEALETGNQIVEVRRS